MSEDALAAADVFVSYASADAAVANVIVAALEQNGLRCWIAPRDVVPGSLYADGIVRAINGTRFFVLVLSEHAVASAHVGKEIERASSKQHPIFAVRTDAAPLTPAFEYFLSESQWIDVAAGSIDAAAARLVAAIRRNTPSGPAESNRQAVSIPAPAVRVSRLKMWGIGILLALVVAAGLLWRDTSQVPTRSVRTGGLEDPFNWTVVVQPFTVPADGSLDAIADIALNDLTRTLATMDLVVQRPVPANPIEAARYRLYGSVQRVGDAVTLALELLTADSGRVVWARTFTALDATGFERTERAAGLIRATVFALALGDDLTTRSEAARDELVASVGEVHKTWYTAEGNWLVAVRHAETALRLDPTLVEAHFWLAVYYSTRLGYSLRAEDALPKARAHVERVLEADADVTWALGLMQYQLELDYAGAMESLERARGSGGLDAVIDNDIGGMLLAQGRLDEALASLQSANARGSVNDVLAAVALAQALELAGRYGEAHRTLERVLGMTDDASWFGLAALLGKVRVCHAEGDLVAAKDALDRALRAHGGARPEEFPGVLALLGRTDEARRILAALDARVAVRSLPFSSAAFEGAFLLGDLDRAFVWLDRAIDNRELWFFSRLRLAPELAPLRADPRFITAMARLEAIEKPSPR